MPYCTIDNQVVHISVPRIGKMWIQRAECPTCLKPRFMLHVYEEWYGVSCCCLRCGDTWEDNEQRERPFKPGWRHENIHEHRRLWWRFHQREERPRIDRPIVLITPLQKRVLCGLDTFCDPRPAPRSAKHVGAKALTRWLNRDGEQLTVSGVQSCLRGLERRGFVKKVNHLGKYRLTDARKVFL